MKSCCFTGHRFKEVKPYIEERLREELERLIAEGVTDFYSGGAYGWDMICGMQVIEQKLENPVGFAIKLHLLLPCPPNEQCELWDETDRLLHSSLMNVADSVETLSDKYYKDCCKVRNQRLVDLADVCVCYYDERRSISGTGQTVRMAQRKGIQIINMFEYECDST